MTDRIASDPTAAADGLADPTAGTATDAGHAASGPADPPALARRRGCLQAAGAGLAASFAGGTALAAGIADNGGIAAAAANRVTLSPIENTQTEAPAPTPDPNAPRDTRIGFAIVGLGRLSLDQILPALGQCKYAKVSALVSGDPDKARRVASQYDVKPDSIYSYERYDELANNPDVQVIYIVLPNSMHADFTVRGARAGKHILCEKPMATSVADCERMIEACRRADRKLMIAYRSQYEPLDRAVVKMVREKKLGDLCEFIAGNSQNTGDPTQWRLNLKLAGGGAMPDIGTYCLNAARFLSGEEPNEVLATITQDRSDPRFREVESAVHFILRFPSGLSATCVSSYASHESRFYRLQGSKGWVEANPAFGYEGLRLRHGTRMDEQNVTIEPTLPALNQFAREIDHMALCVARNQTPHTPGEEGLQDQKITEAIYQSARTGRAVKLSPPPGPTRGPDPDEEHF
ncbi:MAG: Gfo/Idh/MocA family protein [Janthinobacterium lividum]